MAAENQLDLGPRFNPGFIDRLAGRIIKEPVTALVELVANAWDAFATRVDVSIDDGDQGFSIEDNGHGMTPEQFAERWETLFYNRRTQQEGEFAEMPEGLDLSPRRVFGRNGQGRYAAFCFGSVVRISTWRDGYCTEFRVREGREKPLDIEFLATTERVGHGTRIEVDESSGRHLKPLVARRELGLRFLTAPDFEVYVDGEKVEFSDLPDQCLEERVITVDGVGEIQVRIIESARSTITSKRRGVAWIVSGRRVGTCSWDGFTIDGERIDRRRRIAKKVTLLVTADCLDLPGVIEKDWSGFRADSTEHKACLDAVAEVAREWLDSTTQTERSAVRRRIRQAHSATVARLRPLGRERWNNFVDEALESCPSIQERDLIKLTGLLAKLEASDSKYELIHLLETASSGDLDGLTEVLDLFTVRAAKIVLDELHDRLALLQVLQQKLSDPTTQEVQEMQPLFERGLWIFGPQFESIHYSSNRGMTQVLQTLLGVAATGSLNRPDFVVLPDGSLGAYSRPDYDDTDGHERGIASLVIVELKKPGVRLGEKEKAQVWKYVKELGRKGAIQQKTTRVTGYVLGESVDPMELDPRKEWDDTVRIVPLCYGDFIARAQSRTFNLVQKIQEHHPDEDLQDFYDVRMGEPTLI